MWQLFYKWEFSGNLCYIFFIIYFTGRSDTWDGFVNYSSDNWYCSFCVISNSFTNEQIWIDLTKNLFMNYVFLILRVLYTHNYAYTRFFLIYIIYYIQTAVNQIINAAVLLVIQQKEVLWLFIITFMPAFSALFQFIEIMNFFCKHCGC